ncbi:MAG: MFS transporter [Anaerolineaceae bacterium]|nr:MFS transporter [Anaerolineaceae bacterium]
MTKLSRLTKLLYGSADIGFSMTSTIIGAYFAIFLTDVVGISPGIAAIAIFAGRSWDYVNDPIMGYLSDRTRSRWGRRRPFLLFGALPYALAFIMIWWRPEFLSGDIALAVYYAFAYVLYDTAATFVYMPYFALTPELTDDYDERTKLTSYRMVFSIVGSLVAFIVPMMIIRSMQPENSSRVLLMGVIFGLASALPLLLVFFGTRERKVFTKLEKPKFWQSLKAALRNRPFVFGAVIYLLTWASVNIVQANLLFYIKYVIVREEQSTLIMAVIFVVAMFSVPLWEWASRHWNKRLAYIFGIAFWAVVQIALIFVTPVTSLALIVFLCVLAGIGVGAAHVLPWSILPDAIEWDEYETGERHEGMFYSLVTLASKVASSIAIPLSLLVLQLTGYVPNMAQQSKQTLTGIRLVIGPIPAVLLLGGIIFAIFYPLGREKHQALVKELELRRQGKLEKGDQSGKVKL